MKTDFEGLHELLKKDLDKFLNDMKDTLIPMLDLGLDEKLKADLIRAMNGLKALSGMFELHNITDFIAEVESIITKIFELNRKEIANDILNDFFEIRDQIELIFNDYIKTSSRQLCEELKAKNKERIDELSKHYVEYKIGKETLQVSQEQKAPVRKEEIPTPTEQIKQVEEPATKRNEELYVSNDIMYFAPKSLKQNDVQGLQESFVSKLDNVKQIEINLGQTNKIDFIGIQFVQSIKKHCKVSGIKFAISEQSELVVLEAGILGVEL